MNALMQPAQVMTSREISDLCQKEHKNVLRVIRDLIDGQILAAQIEPLKFEYRGQWFDYYALNKRDSLVVVARLSPEFTAAVVDRWQELEAAVTLPNFLDPAEAAEAWAYQFRARQALQNQITEQAPKVAFADSVCSAVNSVSVGDFAKMVSQDGFIIGQNKLFAWLRDQGFLMRRGNMPYQKYIDCGWFEVIEQEFATPTGIRVNSKTLITGRGQLQIHARLIV
jgi:phage antirepressor YoqD-like protein